MYEKRTNTVKDRIVSITRLRMCPIVRGKTKQSAEFGAKISASLVDGYVFVGTVGWDAYSEAVIADKLYRNRCREHVIRLSGPKLGRPSRQPNRQQKPLERQDASARNAIEGKFGEGKTKCGLDRITVCLKNTSETVISVAFFRMNISCRLRFLLAFLLSVIFDKRKHKFGISYAY